MDSNVETGRDPSNASEIITQLTPQQLVTFESWTSTRPDLQHMAVSKDMLITRRPSSGARPPGLGALHAAAAAGDNAAVAQLLATGAEDRAFDIDELDGGSGCSALQAACFHGHASTCDVLLREGADVEVLSRSGRPTREWVGSLGCEHAEHPPGSEERREAREADEAAVVAVLLRHGAAEARRRKAARIEAARHKLAVATRARARLGAATKSAHARAATERVRHYREEQAAAVASIMATSESDVKAREL